MASMDTINSSETLKIMWAKGRTDLMVTILTGSWKDILFGIHYKHKKNTDKNEGLSVGGWEDNHGFTNLADFSY